MQKKKYSVLRSNTFFLTLFFCCHISGFGLFSTKDLLVDLKQSLSISSLIQKYLFTPYGSEGFVTRNILTTPLGLYEVDNNAFTNHVTAALLFLVTTDGIVFNDGEKTLGGVVNTSFATDLYNKKIYDFVRDLSYGVIDAPYLLESFKSIPMLQKRFGALLSGSYSLREDCVFYAQLPLMYKVYYPSLPSEIQAVISMEVDQFNLDKDTSTNQSRDLIIKHSVFDTIGIESPLVGVSKKFFNEILSAQLRLFLPGIDIKSPIGGNFKERSKCPIDFSFYSLFKSVFEPDESKKKDSNIVDNFLNSIDRVIFGSYYSPFYYNPYAFSPSLSIVLPFAYGYSFYWYGTYIYSFSQQRTGVAMKKKSSSLIKDVNNIENFSSQEADRFLESLFKQIEYGIVPELVSGVYHYGPQYQTTLALSSYVSDIGGILGVDFWMQRPSYFEMKEMLPVDSENAQSPQGASQINLFSNLEFYREFRSYFCTLTVGGQVTVYASGIAKEYGGKVDLSLQY